MFLQNLKNCFFINTGKYLLHYLYYVCISTNQKNHEPLWKPYLRTNIFFYKECLFWCFWGNSFNKESFRYSIFIIHYTVYRILTSGGLIEILKIGERQSVKLLNLDPKKLCFIELKNLIWNCLCFLFSNSLVITIILEACTLHNSQNFFVYTCLCTDCTRV